MRVFYGFFWSLARYISKLIFRLKIINVDYIPEKGPFILAANHISYADPPILGSFVPREIHFMAKKELFRNKLFGALISRLNSHPVDRRGFDRKSINHSINLLQSGEGLLVFPEGTRSKNGEFLPARPGVGMIAKKSAVPIVPAYISGSNRLLSGFPGRVKSGVIFGRPIMPDDLAKYEDNKDGYKNLAEEIMNRIKELKKEFDKKAQGA